MAMAVATPENLSDFAQQLGAQLAQQIGSGPQGSGSASGSHAEYIHIESYISMNVNEADGIYHLYIGVDSSVDISGCTLRYCRKKRVNTRRNGDSPYNNNPQNTNAHTTGWHQIWRLPLHSAKVPLFTPVLVSSTPSFTIGNMAYYEITVDGYDTFYEFVTSEDESTGYQYKDDNDDIFEVPYTTLLSKKGGVCLMRNGVQVSGYAMFRFQYNEHNDIWCIGK